MQFIFGLLAGLLALVVALAVWKFIEKNKIKKARESSDEILKESQKEAEKKRKEILIEAKDQAYTIRSEADKEVRQRRQEIAKLERRLVEKEESIDKKLIDLSKKEDDIAIQQEQVIEMREEVKQLYENEKQQLENIAQLTEKEARELLMKKTEEHARHDMAILIKSVEEQAKEDAEKKARNIISLAIQRCASDHVAETTVSVVSLPNDDMKGRIIGREGRNIRAFENLTGINLIIDDTPEAVILSGFDPIRREIARKCIESLITDGRIQPARIEEMYKKTKRDVEAEIKKAGEETALEVDARGIHPELLKVLGRLKYRSSYGQNVLQHSIEVAYLSGIIASELGTDIRLAKRAGLLHDLGKAIDHEIEGSHALIGADLAKRLKENKEVCHAIEAHHDEVEARSVEAVIVKAADALSASRPGARRENLESYIKRLEKLEALAESHKGVEKCYAVQAGREVRVLVNPGAIDDAEASLLAKEIAKSIEEELEYPGQIKVSVIRELRSVEYAK